MYYTLSIQSGDKVSLKYSSADTWRVSKGDILLFLICNQFLFQKIVKNWKKYKKIICESFVDKNYTRTISSFTIKVAV